MKRLLLIVVLLSVFVPMTHAQDDENECDVEAAQTALETALGELDSADDPLEVISEARQELARVEAECLGLAPVEGDSDTVIGPLVIPEGTYRLSVETDGFFSLTITVLEGDCGPTGFGELLFNLFDSDTPGRVSETVLQSEGCEALLQASNVLMGDGFVLLFEKLD